MDHMLRARRDVSTQESPTSLTEVIGATCDRFRTVQLPDHIVRIAQHCLLDWAAVTVGGLRDPLAAIITETACEDSIGGPCTLVGQTGRVTQLQAALVNGTISHALDYDDVNSRMHGHPTVAVASAVLAVAEAGGHSGADLIRAFVGGYQVAGQLGAAMGELHYRRGFHATGTIGAVAAAAGCAILMGLTPEQTRNALGLAASQSAGLKANFGTMAKPLHAGKAAQNGVLAARLAQKGFTSRDGIFERDQGFGPTMSDDFSPELANGPEWEIEDNLFKYHAACYLTHSSIEALRQLQAKTPVDPETVSAVRLHVPEGHSKVCDVRDPKTGLDVKFSIRHLAALALNGANTASLDLYSDVTAQNADLGTLRKKVELVHDNVVRPRYQVDVVVETTDGRKLKSAYDVGTPATDLDMQEKALRLKASSLMDPVLGDGAADTLFQAVDALPTAPDLSAYFAATTS
ncbi:MmgE/PrpD family protein [Pseudooceanicola sp. MF1-13]|uniref:MmgE/PrpD family protein n=1 Tax=Pseudooceanicola sp. MF1-13 TaxID=3379095 RepID=UPI0038917244